MFDSLKKKLGNFRKDVEETAEEKAEEAEGDDVEAEADAADAEAVDAETEPVAADAAADTDAVESDIESEPEPVHDADPESGDSGPPAASAGASEPTHEEPASADTDAVPSADPRVDETEPGHAEAAPTDRLEDEDDVQPVEADAADAATESPAEDEDDDTSSSKSTGFGSKLKAAATGKVVIEEDDLEGPLWELEMALLEADVEMSVAEEILDKVKADLVGERRGFTTSTGTIVEDALRDALYDVISVGQFDFDQRIAEGDKPLVIVFTGVNGVGKTTSIAKLAQYFEDRGLSTVLANGDTYRAGANEQIREHADNLDKKLIAHEQGGDPAAVIYDAVEYAEAHDIDIVLGDTAGRLHTNEGLMDQLEKIGRVVGPDMTLFVDEAVAGQDAVQRAKKFDEAATIDGAILTKADADSNGGAAISIAHVTGKPILFLGVGQAYDDLERFDPDVMVERLLGDETEE
ncbi:signal recognition particle-docking protein FtsY [Haloarchaeobius sp. DFWS5]|uniref:signal recognition particle-docking protein FtsY n=1 Tax=Haloarchaeobius sp. DFWS5 TaxID=3446114 RepID=UPI003EB8B5B5